MKPSSSTGTIATMLVLAAATAVAAQGLHATRSAQGLQTRATTDLLQRMQATGPLRLEAVELSDGRRVDLDLTRVPLKPPAILLRGPDGRTVPAGFVPDVRAFSGTIAGVPDTRAFIGWDGKRLHGWIQSQDGLDVIAADPGSDASWVYRPGARGIGGGKAPPPHRVEVANPAPETHNEYGRLLQSLGNEDVAAKVNISAEGIADLVERAAQRADGEYEELGGCCIAPGFCFFIDEATCALFCDNPSAVTCDDLGPSADAPCWLGPDVGCDTRWGCFEENDEGGWVGACCYPDPDDPSFTLLEDKQACECALLGGTFLIEPANCLSGLSPADYPADRFVSADLIEELDPEACIKPAGACCIDQDLLCLPDQPDLPMPLDQVTCMMLPQALCESDDPKVLTALNASAPGVFTRECFPCVYDTASSGVYSDAPPICSMFTVEREDPDNDDFTAVQLLEPVNFRCTPLKVAIELDAWIPDLFAEPIEDDDDGIAAATGYVTLLFAAVADLYATEARVPLVLSDIIVQAREDTPFGDGACCFDGYCWENAYEEPCETSGGDWLGHGSSCHVNDVCQDEPIYGGGQPPMSIYYVLERLRDRWTSSGACCLDDDTCLDLPQADCDAQGGTFTAAADCGGFDCETGSGTHGYSMIIAVAGAPFLSPWLPEFGAAAGLYDPRGVVEEVGGVCRPHGRFGVAPIRGGFAPPPESNQLGNAQWDLVMLAQVMTRLVGVSPTDDYGYDDCYTRLCRGMGARVDCDLYWSDPMAWALGDMASTIMSNCLACEGGLSNIQMRFRSEIAARIYATAAAAPCSSEELLDPESAAIANDDVFTVPAIGPTTLDVLFNDVPAGCQVDVSSDPVEIADDADHPMPGCTSDPTTGVPTEQGGWACRDEDVEGYEYIRYTPPADFCGVDRFTYVVEEAADDAFATVSVVSRGNTTLASECAVSHTITCEPDCTVSDGEASSLPVPPVAGAPNVIAIQAGALAGTRVDTIRWQDVQLEVLVATSQSAHATMRFWFTSQVGGTDLDVYWDIIPYGDTIAIQCLEGPVPLGVGPAGGGIQDPVSGICESPATGALLYVPDDGQVLVQCFEQLDEDNTQVDAQWIGGSLCLGSSSVSAPGACCLGDLCIQLTANECAALEWVYDPHSETWVRDPIASGFFMGEGTSCDRDWCSREAPCCLEDECITVPPSNCAALGGIVLRGGYGPMYDTPCAFTVCRMNLEERAQGACCITTDTGLRFCADLTYRECQGMPALAPAGSHWKADWQVRATCDYTPCGSTNWNDDGGDGACCFPGACCTQSLTDEQCATAGGVWLENGSCDDCLTVQRGVCCVGAQGPISQGAVSACAENVSQAACSLMGGTWVGGLDDCTDGAPCSPWEPGDACCIQGICMDLTEEDCNIAGGRSIRGVTCSAGGACVLGVCCVDGVQMPGTDEDGLTFQAVDESTCVTSGGRWIGSGECIFIGGVERMDLDGDGRVGASDLLMLLTQWGAHGGQCDLDGDGLVGLQDLLLLISAWSP